jgi:hypothetical protein
MFTIVPLQDEQQKTLISITASSNSMYLNRFPKPVISAQSTCFGVYGSPLSSKTRQQTYKRFICYDALEAICNPY